MEFFREYLVKLQAWIKREGLKVVVIFEGRDAAGKGGVIKRITEYLSLPRRRPARHERQGSHPVVLPALCRPPADGGGIGAHGPELIQPRRRRAGDGVLQRFAVP